MHTTTLAWKVVKGPEQGIDRVGGDTQVSDPLYLVFRADDAPVGSPGPEIWVWAYVEVHSWNEGLPEEDRRYAPEGLIEFLVYPADGSEADQDQGYDDSWMFDYETIKEAEGELPRFLAGYARYPEPFSWDGMNVSDAQDIGK